MPKMPIKKRLLSYRFFIDIFLIGGAFIQKKSNNKKFLRRKNSPQEYDGSEFSFHTVSEKKSQFSVCADSNIFNHQPPQLFIKSFQNTVRYLKFVNHAVKQFLSGKPFCFFSLQAVNALFCFEHLFFIL